MKEVRLVPYIDEGVVVRYTEAEGFGLAVCVGFTRDYRPRVRHFRATSGRWSAPRSIDRLYLAPLAEAHIDGPSPEHDVLADGLSSLFTTPNLGFRPVDLGILVAAGVETSPPTRVDGGTR